MAEFDFSDIPEAQETPGFGDVPGRPKSEPFSFQDVPNTGEAGAFSFDDVQDEKVFLADEAGRAILSGLQRAGQSALGLTRRAAEAMEGVIPLGSIEVGPEGIQRTEEFLPGPSLPEVDRPQTMPGHPLNGKPDSNATHHGERPSSTMRRDSVMSSSHVAGTL